MTNRWKQIWLQRQWETTQGSTLQRLMTLDGFDRLGKVDEEAWRAYGQRLTSKLGIAPGDSVFETGCGAGAFLYPFYEQNHPVGGVDYAANLVQIAAQAMPEGRFEAAEAHAISSDPYDCVVAHGVFLYFPDYEYAAKTLKNMVAKARRSVGILDVPNVECQADALRVRQDTLGPEEYSRLYDGLPHLYFNKEWFREALASTPCEIHIEDQFLPGYLHSQFRFNVFVRLENPT